ncbi:NAD(P)-dependent oxidoreductase [Aquabacterium sp. J223]|uniref:NAD(P)-dependent oxidoreductase n=1 Tax=Aquabacterium sp. J223 TaxID=2898431 RepID=UPI0021AE21DA|nr:NAD(P)-dependent oxidoreductase [Aquabacterium sp. J223]UUX95351.1 NAD(P)-dependent oxidoreductase [Aquabacterium sp. J223]
MVTPSPVVGMIGIGQLGLPIAVNLIRAGHPVVGFRRSDREAFAAAGGRVAHSPAEVARAADVLLLCLPDERAQAAVLDGEQGVMGALTPGKVVIELGTYRREFKIAQADRLRAQQVEMLEVEVSGSPPMVADRRAALYIGGDASLMERCRPILTAITEHHFHLGDIGSAVAMKLIANALVTVHTLAAAEAMNLGVRAGFDAHRVAEVLRHGAGNSAMFSIRAPLMAARRFSPAPGPFETLEKYLHMGREMAHSLGCATPLFSTAVPYFERAIAAGMAQEDISAVIKLVEDESNHRVDGENARAR